MADYNKIDLSDIKRMHEDIKKRERSYSENEQNRYARKINGTTEAFIDFMNGSMEEAIIKEYIINQDTKELVADMLIDKISDFPDLRAELVLAITNDAIPENGIVVAGYSAKDIAELASFMNYVGVYSFLGDLRRDPKVSKEYVKQGFPRK